MKIALVNPPWSFEGSIYFGCREPHLPLEYGYSRALLVAEGHEVSLIDAQLEGLSLASVRERVIACSPELTVITTAPSYLFWRCAPPELRVPMETVAAIRDVAGTLIAVGPHASTTPRSTLAKLSVEACVMGECEEILVALAGTPRERWLELPSLAHRWQGLVHVQGGPHASDLTRLPALTWERSLVDRHAHHHHRFDAKPRRAGAEVEFSRGCPYHCTFCAKENYRDAYRKRPLPVVMRELDALLAQGVEYVYFIDEIFLPDRPLLEALCERRLSFGVQLRIDNWTPELLDLLGRAGCVSIEAGVESITPEGRARLEKRCRMSTEALTSLLVHAKARVPFVQANLLDASEDPPEAVEAWRQTLLDRGVWANKPVPLFPYPGSPEYRLRFGVPDDQAWERAHADYLARFAAFSDIQEAHPRGLDELERAASSAGSSHA